MATWIPNSCSAPDFNTIGLGGLIGCIDDDPDAPDADYISLKTTIGAVPPTVTVGFPSAPETVTQLAVKVLGKTPNPPTFIQTVKVRDGVTLIHTDSTGYVLPNGVVTTITMTFSGHVFTSPTVEFAFGNTFGGEAVEVWAVRAVSNGSSGGSGGPSFPDSSGYDPGAPGGEAWPQHAITPFYSPQIRPGFDDGQADVLLPLNEQSGNKINNLGKLGVITLSGVDQAEEYIACSVDAGVKRYASRTPGTSLTNTFFTAHTNHLGERLSIFEIDAVPLFKDQTSAGTLVIRNRRFSGSGIDQNSVKGVLGFPAFPTTVAELDALTLTSASATFGPSILTTATDTTSDIGSIIDEIVAQSGWEFGDPIYLVVVNDASQGKVCESLVEDYKRLTVVPDVPRCHRPLTENGNFYNIGGYADSSVALGTGDTIDYDNIRYSGATAIGDDVAEYLTQPGGNEYVEYLNHDINWTFYNVFSPGKIPDFLDLATELALLPTSNSSFYFEEITVEDDAGTIIGRISGPQYTWPVETSKSLKHLRVPLSKRLIDPSRLSKLVVRIKTPKVGSSTGTSILGDIKFYSVNLRPIYGQRGQLTISGLGSGTTGLTTVSFWLHAPYSAYGELAYVELNERIMSLPLSSGDTNELALTTKTELFTICRVSDDLVRVYRNNTYICSSNVGLGIDYDSITIGPIQGAIGDFRFYKKPVTEVSNEQLLMRKRAWPDPSKIENEFTPVYADPLILMMVL